jgi:hypothetical protein
VGARAGWRANAPKAVGGNGRLSIAAVCLEAGCSRNALYDGHPELLVEIRAAIERAKRTAVQKGHNQRRSQTEAELARCRDERQRLISENAGLLLRALTAEEALARLKRQAPRPLKMTDDTAEAS